MSRKVSSSLLVLGCNGPPGPPGAADTIGSFLLLLVFAPHLVLPILLGGLVAAWALAFAAWRGLRFAGRALPGALAGTLRRLDLRLAAQVRRSRARSRARRVARLRKAHAGAAPPGSSWARGERPNGAALDLVTREALETLWLEEAEREQAAVAAAGCTAWLLAAAGAPLELLRETHAAGEASASRAQTCFAIASGYGRRARSARPRRELIRGPRMPGDALAALGVDAARTRLWAEYRAEVAAASAVQCAEPVAREALLRLVRDAEAQAALARRIEAWVLERQPSARRPMRQACRALRRLHPARIPPAARGAMKWANGVALRRAGRLPEAHAAALWRARVKSHA